MLTSCLGRFLKRITKCSEEDQGCASCWKRIPAAEILTVPCGHTLCRICLRQMALTALDDQELFPVKCCGSEIPQKLVTTVLGSRNRKLYTSRLDEYAIPPSERLYCPEPKCARWINPKHQISRLNHMLCPYCKTKICPECRDVMHDPRDCSYDPNLQSVLDLAKRENWQRCLGCHAIVEIDQGCAHIVCRCKTEFCYLCGSRWRTCSCVDIRARQEDVIGAEEDVDVHILVNALDNLDWPEDT